MSATATPEGLPRRALVWAAVTVVGVLAAVALDRLAGSVDDDVGRRAADDARAKLAVAVAAIRTDVETGPNLRGEDLVAAVSGRVADVYRGVVTEVAATDHGARVDAYVDGDATEVVFTLRRAPGMTDDELERDAGLVTADLARLKDVLERR